MSKSVSVTKRMVLHPLNSKEIPILGIVFDMDGTLTKPQTYMFKEMREALGIVGKPIDILDKLSSITDPEEKEISELKIKKIEEDTMLKMEPQEGLLDMLEFLKSEKLKFTICTRNLIKPVNHLRSTYLPEINFHEPIVTREFIPPKPSPLPLLHIAKSWDIKPENLIMVGDSRDDMYAGLNAGFSMVLLKHDDNGHLVDEIPDIDFVVQNYHQFVEILKQGFDKKSKIPKEANKSGY
ncbi:hypothetical protein CANARDRAFT_9301 [[Candida] arabinofermentans NRRL YB-2248]|uniref:HAD-like protein n=1 Tax=[Candida] arabinofermentans NRRL YB-2248 TaxID=983967 RepID=A0A1E4SW94_9ASCO|nr:hypothetical protein CANARDRAFT_9301 [[Candida] arabinofermentans NRRL YB-2248]